MFARILGPLALALVALSLGSCAKQLATIETDISAAGSVYTFATTATVTQIQAKALHDAIYTAEGLSAIYMEEPACSTTTPAGTACRGSTTSKKVASAVVALRSADNTLVAAIATAHAAGTGVGVASTTYNIAVGAYNTYATAYSAAKASST